VAQNEAGLVKKLNVTPIENIFSRQLEANPKITIASLKSKGGAAFDRAYVKNEVAYYKAVSSTVEKNRHP
jgi:putative membrane protein